MPNSEADSAAMIGLVYRRVTTRPRDYLERIEAAALRWASARRRCDAIRAEHDLRRLLTTFREQA